MKFRNSNALLATFIITLLAVGIYTTANYLFPTIDDDSSALTYGSSTNVSFTFNPKLSIATSTDSLTIDNLVPGNTSDSNTVSVTVSSNTPYGYVLSAGVGSTVSTDPYYNTSDLVHDNTTTQVPTTNKFTSISTSASLESLDADNTWGYSTSTDGGTSWSTYSGLSYTATKPLLDISDPATPSTIDFKIAARSASTQASGTYNNVITFYAVGKPAPAYMQEAEIIKSLLKNIGDETQAIDQRDGKEYWIRKMADGNIWMTQNLDLELDSTRTYTPADTDVSANWQPTRSTIEFTDTTVSDWINDYYTPYSASPGELYMYTSGTKADDGQYASLTACQAEHPDCSTHNHVGNYYNWSAAVASNYTYTTELNTQYNNAPDSICPAGWRLPVARNSADTAASREWNALMVAENIMANPTGTSYAINGFNNIRISPLWLTRFGYVNDGSLSNAGNHGDYWTSTVYSRKDAYRLYFNSSDIYPAMGSNGNYGYPIRCLVE